MWLIMVIAIIITVVQFVKEKSTKKIPSENWGDGSGWRQDILDGVSHEERMRRLHTGYYNRSSKN